MANYTFFESLAKQLFEILPTNLCELPTGLERQFYAILKSAFEKMDLVTTEEFSIQTRVLTRTRNRLEQLEKELSDLKEKFQISS